MKLWIKVLAGAIPGAAILLLPFLYIWFRRRPRQPQPPQFISQTNTQFSETAAKSRGDSFQSGIAKIHRLSYKSSSKTSLRFHHLHHHQDHHLNFHQQPSPFNWDDHPRLISEAAENGWSRFVFANRSSIPRSSPLWGFCAVCDGGRPHEAAAVNWEVPLGSSEFMQTVRLTPPAATGPKRSGSSNNNTSPSPLHHVDDSSSSIRMSLPLPGPPLGGSSFPQEAYFEITILYLQPRHRLSRASKRSKGGQGDRAKLIRENSVETNTPFQEAKSIEGEGKHNNNPAAISLGLTMGGSPPSRPMMPGTSPGSIGFHSNGSVYLDGMKLVSESEKTEWAGVNMVIGCGFNLSKKKVFLTVESELVHVIRCSSDVFKNPLYPVLASNSDVMVLVNLGQAAFKYAPANALRTANPCFLHPAPDDGGRALIGYEDSRELFSMGRLDSKWIDGTSWSRIHNSSSNKRNGNLNDGSVVVDVDGESDLFEIALHS